MVGRTVARVLATAILAGCAGTALQHPDAGTDVTLGDDVPEADGATADTPADTPPDAPADTSAEQLDHQVFTFSQQDGLAGIATGDFATPGLEYPPIQVDPSYTHVLAFQMSPMMPPLRQSVTGSGPIVVYTDAFDAIVLSPLDHFFESLVWFDGGQLHMGVEGEIDSLPPGFTHRFIMVRGHGIDATIERWGALILADRGRKPVDRYADTGLSYVGYWTDNGTHYYYQTAPGMDAQDTLLAVKADADGRGIPLGYVQLDSWWYFKDPGSGLLAGGLTDWDPQPQMFPDGLAAFRAKLGLPLITHNRWFAKDNTYSQTWPFVDSDQMAFPTTGDVFGKFMADARSWGVTTYEQDWLMSQFQGVPWLRQAPGRAEAWMGWMSDAAVANGLTMQICMPGAAHLMDAVDRPAVTTVRTSVDHMSERAKEAYWPAFHIVNMLASALGVWPFKDNFETTEFGGEAEALISVLSAGMVGIGDEVGKADAALVARTCRQDGMILKPDRPATPVDAMFTPHERPFTVVTWSRREGLGQWTYLAAFNLAAEHPERTDDDRLMSALLYDARPLTDMWVLPDLVTDWHVDLAADAGVDGQVVAYDWRAGTAQVVTGGLEIPPMEHIDDFAYFVLAPVLSNGMALIGETAKFVTVADRRVNAVSVEPDALVVTVAGVPGEAVTLSAFDVAAGHMVAPATVAIGPDGTAVATLAR